MQDKEGICEEKHSLTKSKDATLECALGSKASPTIQLLPYVCHFICALAAGAFDFLSKIENMGFFAGCWKSSWEPAPRLLEVLFLFVELMVVLALCLDRVDVDLLRPLN